jgi:hypothetical protein
MFAGEADDGPEGLEVVVLDCAEEAGFEALVPVACCAGASGSGHGGVGVARKGVAIISIFTVSTLDLVKPLGRCWEPRRIAGSGKAWSGRSELEEKPRSKFLHSSLVSLI